MDAYQIKITVKSRKPPVWWRVIVPRGITFSALSLILDETIGLSAAENFEFEFYRELKLREPVGNEPLKPELDIALTDASGSFIDRPFDAHRTLSYTVGYSGFRIEIEKEITGHTAQFPLLLKMRAEGNVEEQAKQLQKNFRITAGKKDFRTKAEIIRQAEEGVFLISAARKPVDKEGAYVPSYGEQLRNAMTELHNLRKELDRLEKTGSATENSAEEIEYHVPGGQKRYPIRTCLSWYPKKDIQEIAERLGAYGWERKSKPELVEEVAALLLDPAIMRTDFYHLENDEIQALEDALSGEGTYTIPEAQMGRFDELAYMGYVFLNGKETLVDIPEELPAVYKSVNTSAFREKRAKVRWVMQCLNEIVPPYYGIIPLSKFCRLCRRSENPAITPEEVPGLLKLIPEDSREATLYGDLICEKYLKEHPELYQDVVRAHGDKPWYIMRYREMEELLQYGYPKSSGWYRRLERFLKQEAGLEGKELEKGIHRIHIMIANSRRMQDIVDYLEDGIMEFREDSIEEFAKLFQNLVNHTSTYYNRGYSPNAMAEISGGPALKNLRFS